MSKAKSVLIRFHTDHANEKAAYAKLAALQEQTHLSQSQIVAAALNRNTSFVTGVSIIPHHSCKHYLGEISP